ncbi:MAG: nitroreductase family protein [Chloroflexi bacterium]|nr:nitroreductase family protein [Chloroflexota bacterium]
MDIYAALKTVRSVRQYRDEPVDDAIINRIIEAGRWAGSAKNTQPWQYILVKRRETLAQLSTYGGYASHLRNAAFAILVITEEAARAEFDAGRTIQNMLLAAWADGVGSCVVSLGQDSGVKPLLGIPDQYKVQQAVAFGYPAPNVVPTVEGKPLKEVLAALGRKPLNELLHTETWQGRAPGPAGEQG